MGMEAAGVVDQIGDGVSGELSVGDRVMAITPTSGTHGAYAESAAVELVSYLAINPGADHHAVDDALWPGRLVNKQMGNGEAYLRWTLRGQRVAGLRNSARFCVTATQSSP